MLSALALLQLVSASVTAMGALGALIDGEQAQDEADPEQHEREGEDDCLCVMRRHG
jgi:hypothetical protein